MMYGVVFVAIFILLRICIRSTFLVDVILSFLRFESEHETEYVLYPWPCCLIYKLIFISI